MNSNTPIVEWGNVRERESRWEGVRGEEDRGERESRWSELRGEEDRGERESLWSGFRGEEGPVEKTEENGFGMSPKETIEHVFEKKSEMIVGGQDGDPGVKDSYSNHGPLRSKSNLDGEKHESESGRGKDHVQQST